MSSDPGSRAHEHSRRDDAARAQRRLRDLLRATTTVVERLDLEVVLRRIVEAARDVSGARYAALGVIGPDGFHEQFVHVGMAAETVEAIGHLPAGRGLLGRLAR